MPFGRPKPGWGDGIELNITEIGWKVVNWFDCTLVGNQGQTLVNMLVKDQTA